MRRLLGVLYGAAPNFWHATLRKLPWLRQLLISAVGIKELNDQGNFVFGGIALASFSQARQDVFVQIVSRLHPYKSYIEIGAAKPVESNNTFALEKSGWVGISVELDRAYAEEWASLRSNPLLVANALELDYSEVIASLGVGTNLGYLQIDIDPAENSLAALKMIPFDTYKFATITFEHDYYQDRAGVRETARRFLTSKGYVLAVSDVEWAPGKNFEDWFVHPDLLSESPFDQAPDRRWFSKETERQLINTFERR